LGCKIAEIDADTNSQNAVSEQKDFAKFRYMQSSRLSMKTVKDTVETMKATRSNFGTLDTARPMKFDILE
jgi:hypothetical protein